MSFFKSFLDHATDILIPEGTTWDDWETRRFAPEKDISAYELAVCLSMFPRLDGDVWFPSAQYAQKHPEAIGEAEQVRRHFRFVRSGPSERDLCR